MRRLLRGIVGAYILMAVTPKVIGGVHAIMNEATIRIKDAFEDTIFGDRNDFRR